MDIRKTHLERAFELARSGKCFDISEVNKRLKSERFDPIYSEGAALKKQLSELIKAARATAEEGTKQPAQH
jgi:hypothetical protein